jgi:hypothetical protein
MTILTILDPYEQLMFVDSPVNGRGQTRPQTAAGLGHAKRWKLTSLHGHGLPGAVYGFLFPYQMSRPRVFSYQMSRFPIEIFEKISTTAVCEGESFAADEM